MLRCSLYHPNFGNYTIDDVDPEGLNNFEIELKRSKDNDGIFYEFSIPLDFNKGARNYIKQVYDTYGIDGEIEIKIYEYDTNNYRFNLEYTGQLRLTNYTIDEVTASAQVEQQGFKRKFLNYLDTDVDLFTLSSKQGISLTDDSITIPLAPKSIQSKAVFQGTNNWQESGYFGGNTAGFHSVIRVGDSNNESDFSNTFLSTDSWFIPNNGTDTVQPTKNYIQKLEFGGDYNIELTEFLFDVRIDVETFFGATNLTDLRVRIRYAIQEGNATLDATPLDLYDQTLLVADFDYTEILDADGTLGKVRYEKYNQSLDFNSLAEADLNVNTEIYIWAEYDVNFVGDGDSQRNIGIRYPEAHRFELTGNTIYPETQCKGFMVYEFLEKMVKYYTDEQVAFRSNFFGRTELGYIEDGEGALQFITNGGLVRGLDKRLFGNYEDAYKSLEAIFCLGWGFETVNGQEVVRIEPKEYFYNLDNVALELDQVAGISKSVVMDGYYQMLEIGYPKIENINQVNGIDEHNSLRRYTSPVRQSKGKLTLVSSYRASGFEIESQRRLTNKTDESKLDDENFIIAVKRDDESFVVEQGADYNVVTGLFDADTAYNLRISPARMANNWSKFLSISVWKSSKIWSFSYGSMNYEVTSQLNTEAITLENGNIDTSTNQPYYYLEQYEFESKLTSDQRKLLTDNPNGVVSFLDWSNKERYGFIQDVKMNIEGKKGIFTLLRSSESQNVPDAVITPIVNPFSYSYYYDYQNEEIYFAFEGTPEGTPSLKTRKTETLQSNVDTVYPLVLNGSVYEVTIPMPRQTVGAKTFTFYYIDDRGETNGLLNFGIIRDGSPIGDDQIFNKYGLRFVLDDKIQSLINFNTKLIHADGTDVLTGELPIQSRLVNFIGSTIVNTDLKTGASNDPANINSIPTFHDLNNTDVNSNNFIRLQIEYGDIVTMVANSIFLDINFS